MCGALLRFSRARRYPFVHLLLIKGDAPMLYSPEVQVEQLSAPTARWERPSVRLLMAI